MNWINFRENKPPKGVPFLAVNFDGHTTITAIYDYEFRGKYKERLDGSWEMGEVAFYMPIELPEIPPRPCVNCGIADHKVKYGNYATGGYLCDTCQKERLKACRNEEKRKHTAYMDDLRKNGLGCHECKTHYYVSDPEHESDSLMPPELCGRCDKHPERFEGWGGVGCYIHIEKGLFDNSEICDDFDLDSDKSLDSQVKKDKANYDEAVGTLETMEKSARVLNPEDYVST